MADLDEREALIRAIYADPADDLPRLVFADWLDERGEADRAEFIRLSIRWVRETQEELRFQTVGRQYQLFNELYSNSDQLPPHTILLDHTDRGFALDGIIRCSSHDLSDPAAFRRSALERMPHWYAATELKVRSGLIGSSKPIRTILDSPVTQLVTQLDLSGRVVENRRAPGADDDPEWEAILDFEFQSTVTLQAVEALLDSRETRRITHLDLTNNDLDNDAARAIVRSTNLIRLQSLKLFEGNQLRGKTWAQLQERFGADVVE